jgi:uncharacterized protein involved in oxidation of intracellular sulfur
MPKTLFILNDPPYMDARGITDTELTDTTHRSTLEELTNWVQWADRTLVF